MLVLGAANLLNLVSPRNLIELLEDALREHAAGRTRIPPRQHVDWDGNTLLTMPAISADAVGIKLVCVVPANRTRGIPVTSGIMVLNDAETGLPLAMLNAATLTALRTGAVGALTVKYSTPHSIESLGIIGCGVQGAWQAVFVHAVRPIREIYCVRRSERSFEQFCSTVRSQIPDARITVCDNARELLARTDLIIAATTSSEPVLPDEPTLLAGKHFVSVGSFRRDMQELPDSVYRLAGAVVIDSEAARHEVGDLLRCVDSGAVPASNVIFIGQLVTGHRTIDTSRTTACKTVGMALYDLYAAHAMYSSAKRAGIGREIDL